MKIYIRATSIISPQQTFGPGPFLPDFTEFNSNRLACIEPDYKVFFDPKVLRRMSRIIKIGVAAALQCLQEGDVKQADAIITGTAYGCLEDTGAFLNKMVENKEEMLSPTSFIQSTHNTVAAQIALILQCARYNNTFTHSGFSFESALLDGIMLLKENEAKSILLGSVDELTNTSFSILERLGLYKRENVSTRMLFASKTKGTIAGEGAAFFLLSSKRLKNDYGELEGNLTFYGVKNADEVSKHIDLFLQSHSLSIQDIDVIITGRNGDGKHDSIYDSLEGSYFGKKECINYKHLCGEYPTSSSFAMGLASYIVKHGTVPITFGKLNQDHPIKKSFDL